MASLKEIADLAWSQMFPTPTDETSISKEEFITTAKSQYAWEMWRLSKEEKREEGVFNIPSNLLTEVDLEIDNGEADISGLSVLRSLSNDTWIANIGGLVGGCRYIATNINRVQLLDDDDSLGDDAKTYLVIGKKIIFPKGVHKNPLPLIYVNDGLGLDEDEVEIDDMIGAIIRTKLLDIYKDKGEEDNTNNGQSKS